ncbi:AAA family ATPase [Sphingomonas sp. BK580]|uniref:AAA family ATPase n=1 Tax=Sphingomonas sp. BK580 TaxID=2586972 RepID=UPI001614CB07|nr:AAA family ATPase [Sphingomonas sp. BK580]MBB3693565.1 putative ATP-dependent endonuclease of OLD family [Sphingomonas sp. BK580]
MDLFSFAVKGYRRFRAQTTLRTNGKLVALVGPNEAGKSSLLSALSGMNSNDSFEQSDHARGCVTEETELVALFLLTKAETALAHLPYPAWMRVRKNYEGDLSYGFRPMPPPRSTAHRKEAVEIANAVLHNKECMEALSWETPDLEELWTEAVAAITDKGPDLSKKALDLIAKVVTELAAVGEEPRERFLQIEAALQVWTEMSSLESAPSPIRHAITALFPSVPKFLFFDEEARNLSSSYAMSSLSKAVPKALESLLAVAGLDVAEMLSAIARDARDDLTTIERRANRTLERSFKEAWRQSGVTVALRLSTDLLEVQVVNEDDRYTRLAERSDGLRQFVALHAFASRAHAAEFILLIDEAEQRLHYDAQADLVQMLARQRLASKVIYTTHSAGCLPEDLGHGVRLIEPIAEEPACSRIVNKFWQRSASGFSPLLFGLGAATLAFFPTRRAVCVEGPSDMLLLPTMFREALKRDALGYQFVPGLSSAARTLAPTMPSQAANVCYLVDGDAAGEAIAGHLGAAAIPTSRIFLLVSANGQAVETEDFLNPGLLLDAANALIAKYSPNGRRLEVGDLSHEHRTKNLRGAFRAATGREMDKVELAYELLDALDERPDLKLLDDTRQDELSSLARRVEEALTASIR